LNGSIKPPGGENGRDGEASTFLAEGVPAKLASETLDQEISVLSIFLENSKIFSNGVQSNWARDTVGSFLYHEVGLRLMPYGLVQFEKLPAAQAKWFKRLVVNAEGNKFILQCKRLMASKNK
jgi:hypothetical protein